MSDPKFGDFYEDNLRDYETNDSADMDDMSSDYQSGQDIDTQDED